jgi:hypothetical protein
VGDSLKASNEQYASSLEETSQQGVLTNQQIGLANTTIEELKQKLAENEVLVIYWQDRAQPREFVSLDELKAWLAKDNTGSTLHIVVVGSLAGYDCDDYATALVQNALSSGFSISTQIVGDHMLNSTIIGNEIYYIEPQNNKVWLWGYRD